ncbi:bifunctional diguanylate cyclase/phosphodiesterase [Deinococcus sp. Leaf326]|uniref:putative bifunctional diguanylate cyclase/phosphodiesterase n=1 Tax=Deinococcus sp. Leaf326 TaxID=1736338 RepID=UPI00138F64A7|nr:EAL domain-containing protein [Deinococcus sp. Leaf326]
MRPPPAYLPDLLHMAGPLLRAYGFPDARIETAPSAPSADAVRLFLGGAADVWVSGMPDAPPEVLQALRVVVADHARWRELLRDRDRLRDVYDRTFEFQGTLLPDGLLVDANETLLAFTGLRRMQVLGKPCVDAPWWKASPENAEGLRRALSRAMAGEFTRQDLTVLGVGGVEARVDLCLTPVSGEGGATEMIVMEGRDITARLRTLHEVEVARAFLEAVLENVQDGIVACDAAGQLTLFNRMAREWHGQGPEAGQPAEWSGKYRLYGPDGAAPLPDDDLPLLRALRGAAVKDQEMVIAPDRRTPRTVLSSGGPLYSASGELLGAVIALHDVTERRQTEHRLRHDALHDRLTGLANRALLYSLLEHAMERFRRQPDCSYAVLFIDLDNFKDVNDAYGHIVGDRLLLEVAARLQRVVRRTDTVARLGGDEFAVLLDSPYGATQVMRIIARIMGAMRRPVRLPGHEVEVTLSIGAALADSAYTSVEEPLRDADTAMYRAKQAGKNGAQLFDQSMHDSVIHRLNTERELREAVTEGQLTLHYQPVIRLSDGACTGFEALVRWQHPVRGLLPPSEFIGVAEACGLIGPLGAWVLEEGARQLRAWRATPELAHLTLAVNISGKQLLNAAQPESRLLGFAFPPGLELEVTESTLIDAPEAVAHLHALAGLGVPLSLDDFGTGYASLVAVQRHPISTLKLDRSFVAPLPAGARQRAIVASVLTLAHHLDLRVIAEGLETPEQVRAVEELGCRYGQGYLFCHAVPADEATAYALAHVPPGLPAT